MKTGAAFSGELLGVEEVARYLGLKQTTVYRWCRERRIACVKISKSWRIRASAVEDFLREREQPVTLSGRLKQFLEVPTSIIGIAQNAELLHRLDAAFLKLGEERGGLLVKFHGGEPALVDTLRKDFERHGLEATSLEDAGRLVFSAEKNPLEERGELLQQIVEEERAGGNREVWVSFDWTQEGSLDEVIHQQQALTRFVSGHRLAVKTALLEAAADDWTMETQRRARATHSGTAWISDAGLTLSRTTPVELD